MIIKVDINTMEREFKQYDRDYFSLDGYQFLLDFYDDLYPDGDYELDVIGICSEWTEYGPYAYFDFKEFISQYGDELDIYEWTRDSVSGFENADDIEIEDAYESGYINVEFYIDALVEQMVGSYNVYTLSNSDVIVEI